MESIDLFETLVRFLAVKPLQFDHFDLEQAKMIIKKDRQASINFIGEHGYFEDILDEAVKRVNQLGESEGSVYLFVAGDSCTSRMERNLLQLILNTKKLFIFGEPEHWPISDPRISFVKPEEIFNDNHQRFFIFQSAGFNVALVARHSNVEGQERIEAAMTNDPEAVSLLVQTIGTKVYQQNN